MTARQRNDLGLIVYSPTLLDADGRPVAIVHAMERALPGLRLEWTTSEEGHRTLLANRDEWLAQQKLNGEFPLFHNGDESHYVSVSGWASPATRSSGGQAQLEIHARLPMAADAIGAAADVLEGIAEATRGFWGHLTPSSAAVDIARQTKSQAANPQPPPRGLPALKLAWDIPTPEIPRRLGWLNYWSAAAARAIGFPDPAHDAELLSRSRRTATGGWVVRLTEAPLDLDNPAHLDALMRAYERFPVIGGRAPPL